MAFSSTGDKVVYGETVKTWVSNGHEGGGKFEPYHYAYVMCAQDDYYGSAFCHRAFRHRALSVKRCGVKGCGILREEL